MEAVKPEGRLEKTMELKDEILYQPILKTGKSFYVIFACLGLIVLFAAFAY